MGADLDRAAGAELEPLVGDVVRCGAGEDVSRSGAPQPDRRHRRGHVRKLRAGHELVAKPLPVRHSGRAAGHNPEVFVAQPHDREVGLESAVRAQHRRVDDASDGHVHLAQCRALRGSERARPDKVEDRERGQVEQARPLTHRQVLGVDDGRPPTRLPLRGAAVDPVAVLLEQRRI